MHSKFQNHSYWQSSCLNLYNSPHANVRFLPVTATYTWDNLYFISTQGKRKGSKLRSKESILEKARPGPIQHPVLSKSDHTHLVGQSAIHIASYTLDLKWLYIMI